MGNHRADRRGPGRRPSDLPTPVAETITLSVAETVTETIALPVTSPVTSPVAVAGKRRAEKPAKPAKAAKAARTASPAKPAKAHAHAATKTHTHAAKTHTHAAAKTQAVEKVRPEPTRRATRRSSTRGPLFRLLPSPPLLLGVAALAISAGGAITAANSGLSDTPTKFSQASALSGASDVSRVSLLGKESVSRDSRRDALDDSSDAELVAEAEAQVEDHNAALEKLAERTQAHADKLALNAWVLPVEGYHLTAQFGDYGLWSHYHTGLDFAADSGTPIHAVANGIVTSVGYDGAYGNKTVLTLDDGTELWFCHQTSYTVSEGQEVHAGDLIGYVGSTGHVTGPHLHLEVRPGAGDPVDPYEALVVHGVTP